MLEIYISTSRKAMKPIMDVTMVVARAIKRPIKALMPAPIANRIAVIGMTTRKPISSYLPWGTKRIPLYSYPWRLIYPVLHSYQQHKTYQSSQ